MKLGHGLLVLKQISAYWGVISANGHPIRRWSFVEYILMCGQNKYGHMPQWLTLHGYVGIYRDFTDRWFNFSLGLSSLLFFGPWRDMLAQQPANVVPTFQRHHIPPKAGPGPHPCRAYPDRINAVPSYAPSGGVL